MATKPSTVLDVECTHCSAAPGDACTNRMFSNSRGLPSKVVNPHATRQEAFDAHSTTAAKLKAAKQTVALNSVRQSIPQQGPQPQAPPEPKQQTPHEQQRERMQKLLGTIGYED